LIPTVELIPPKGSWLLGVAQELTVKIKHRTTIRVYFPRKPLVPGLVLQEVREKRQPLPKSMTQSTMTLVMVPLRLDVQRLPTLDVAWRSLSDPNKSGSIPVDLGRAIVVGQVKNPSEAQLGEAPEGLNIRHRNMTLIMALVALAAAILAILLTLAIVVLLRKTTFRQTPPPVPPDHEALKALEELRAQPSELEAQPALFVTRTSEILRRYLGRRYAFEALEATTEELVKHLEVLAPDGISTLELNQLLRSMDMVKFAAQSTGSNDVYAQIDAVQSLVMKSREEAEERAARELQKKALLPDPSERALALAVDLSIGGALALVFHAAAILTGITLYFVLGLIALGAWLLFRDFTSRSPGKRLGRLLLVPSTAVVGRTRTFRLDEVPPLFSRIVRNLTLLPLVTIPGEILASAFLPDQRRFGDLVSRTRVVRAHPQAHKPDRNLLIAAWMLALLVLLLPAIWALDSIDWGGLL
jgi:uncharacterized RDD family membrane protein YckC